MSVREHVVFMDVLIRSAGAGDQNSGDWSGDCRGRRWLGLWLSDTVIAYLAIIHM